MSERGGAAATVTPGAAVVQAAAAADRAGRGRPVPRGRPASSRKRSAILSTAERLFSGQGIDPISMDRLAEVSGVSKVTAYKYFGSKAGVVEAVFASLVARLPAPDQLVPASGDRRERAQQYCLRLYREVLDSEALDRLRQLSAALLVSSLASSLSVPDLWATIGRGYVEQLARLLDDGSEAPPEAIQPQAWDRACTALVLFDPEHAARALFESARLPAWSGSSVSTVIGQLAG